MQPDVDKQIQRWAKDPYKISGCYVDGLHGIHMWKGILAVAQGYGFAVDAVMMRPYSYYSEQDAIELQIEECPAIVDDLENDIDRYMNNLPQSAYTVTLADKNGTYRAPSNLCSCHYWGRNENSDWGLWECDVDA